MSSPVQQVLVMSSGRSGSTLLDRLLGRHPQVASLGELVQWPKNIALDTVCACGQPVSRCAFWQSVATCLRLSLGIDVMRDPYALDMGLIGATRVRDEAYYTATRVARNKLAQAVLWAGQRTGHHWVLPLAKRQLDASLALYDAVRDASGASLVVDSSKQYLRAMGVYRQAPGQTRLIVLVRDGRAVLYSRMQSGMSMKEAVKRWQRYYQRMQPCLKASVPASDVFYLQYERLASSPQSTLAGIFAFMGLPPADVLAAPEADMHIVEGNAMRLKPLDTIVPDRRWETGLANDARAYFEREAGALNRELGYVDD